MASVLGMNCKAYYNASGVANPIVPANWTLLSNIRDLTLNNEAGEADMTTRANNGWRATVPTLKDGTIDFEMVWDTTDAGFTAIQAAFTSRAAIGMLILDGAIDSSGKQGLAGDFAVMNFSRNEALEDGVKVSVSMKITYSAVAPFWHTVT